MRGQKIRAKLQALLLAACMGGMQSAGNNSIRSRRKAEVGGYRIYP